MCFVIPYLLKERFHFSNILSSIFSPNAGKSGPEKTPYLDTFHALYFGELAFVAVIIFDKKITFENYFRLKLPETIYNWIYLI